MKGSGFKSRGGGLKHRSEWREDGFHRNRLGALEVLDKAYMAELHRLGERPLDLGLPTEKIGVTELHHTLNPEGRGTRRRANDATVVPLDKADHMFIEADLREERALQRVFSTWSSFRYWCWKKGREGTGEDALAYNKWVLEKLEEEDGPKKDGP